MNKKKVVILIVLIVLTVIAVVGFVSLKHENQSIDNDFVSSFVYNKKEEIVSRRFTEAEYIQDINDDPDYLKVTSWINYTRGAITIGLSDGNYGQYDPSLVFFDAYFSALKKGDTSALVSLHSDRYFEYNWKWDEIFPQRVYDIYVEYLFDKDVVDPEYGSVIKYVYKLSYKIMKNDGTFRNDIGSDATKPLYYEIVEMPDGIRFIDAVGNAFNYPEE